MMEIHELTLTGENGKEEAMTGIVRRQLDDQINKRPSAQDDEDQIRNILANEKPTISNLRFYEVGSDYVFLLDENISSQRTVRVPARITRGEDNKLLSLSISGKDLNEAYRVLSNNKQSNTTRRGIGCGVATEDSSNQLRCTTGYLIRERVEKN